MFLPCINTFDHCAWCAYEVDSYENLVEGEWENCDKTCYLGISTLHLHLVHLYMILIEGYRSGLDHKGSGSEEEGSGSEQEGSGSFLQGGDYIIH